MRLTILAGAITLILAGCASNVSNTHSAPRLVSIGTGTGAHTSSAQANEPDVLIPAPNTPATAIGTAAPAIKPSPSLFIPAQPAGKPVAQGNVDRSVMAAVHTPEPTVKAPVAKVAPQHQMANSANARSLDAIPEVGATVTAPVASVNETAATAAQTSAQMVPKAAGPDLSKQAAPKYGYLRVTHLIPGRLTFNDKTKEFEFVIVGGPASLKPNLQTLLSATNGGGLEYKVDENHGYPNTFKLRGQTVTHIIDQMVAPFKQPGQAWQSVYINNMVVIDYTKRMASYAS